MKAPPYWLQFVQPFATALIGMGAAALAYRQWLTSNEKLRLDLFDKRQAFLDDLRECMRSKSREGIENFDLQGCLFSVQHAKPLFAGKAARKSLDKLEANLEDLWPARTRVNRLKGEEQSFDSAYDDLFRLEDELKDNYETVTKNLAAYVEFHARHYRWWPRWFA